MATTNLLVFNPTAVNQENDAAYAADPTRAGGAVDPTIFLSVLANKAFYQWSTYLTALFSAFAAKGFTTSDSNLSTLTSVCANFLTTEDVLPAVAIIAYAATLTLNAAVANGFYITSMTGNLVIAAINGLTSGQLVAMYYQQDSAGGRTVTFPTIMVGAAQPDPLPNAVSLQLFGYDTTTSKLRAFGPLISDSGAFFPATLNVDGLTTLDSLTLDTPGTAGQVLTNVGGQFVPRDPARTAGTRHDVTVSRAFGGGPYTNTYGGAIIVSGYGTTTGSRVASVQCLVDGDGDFADTDGGTVNSGACGFSFVVPNGSTYQVLTNTLTGGSTGVTGLGKWIETVIS